MFCIPFYIAILLLIKLLKLQKIFYGLIHRVDSQFDFEFQQFDRLRSPLINNGKMNIPEFLQQPNNYLDQNYANSEFIFELIIVILRRQCINKHEALYWLGSPKFHIKFIHYLFIYLTLWILVFFFQYLKNFNFYEYFIFSLTIVIILFSIFYLIPKNLYYAIISSKIQLLRDRKLIKKTVLKQKQKQIYLFYRLYNLLKQARKSFPRAEQASNLSIPLQRQLQHYYKLYEAQFLEFPFQGLQMICHQCGNDLTEENFIFLLSDACEQIEAKQEDNEQIEIDPKYQITMPLLTKAVNIKMEEVKFEPAKESQRIIKQLLKQVSKNVEEESQHSQQNINEMDKEKKQTITLRQFQTILNNIFGDPNQFGEEITNIIHEIRYLQTHKHQSQFDVQIIGNMIRNYIEGFPR